MAKKAKIDSMDMDVIPSAEILHFIHPDVASSPASQLGLFLKMARTDLGLEIEPIATYLNIRSIYLEAIEENQPADLPERVYVIGYIKAYATYLGLDPLEAVRLYKIENPSKPAYVSANVPFQPEESKILPSPRVLWTSLGLLGALLVAGLVVNGAFHKNSDPKVQAPVISEATPVELMPELATQPLVEVDPEPVKLVAEQNSWIEIRGEDGKVLVRKTLRAGQTYELSADDALLEEHTLTTGNAGGLKIFVGEQELAPLGKKNETRRGVSLDPEKLLEMQPSS